MLQLAYPGPRAHAMEGEEETPLQVASKVVGLMSIACWIVAQFPQIYQNFKNKDASALSAGFLLLWTMGDASNLVGCFLTGQQMTQTLTAVYFMTVDFMLWFQYLYYGWYKNRQLEKEAPDRRALLNGDHTPPRGSTSSVMLAATPLSLLVGALYHASSSPAVVSTGRTLMSTVIAADSMAALSEDDSSYIAGVVIAWLAASLYVISRIPQIVYNFQRRSVEGLAITLFIFAVLGNVTYAASIFLESVEPEHLLNALPYIIGSAGTIIFDFTIFVQFHVYKHNRAGYIAVPNHVAPATPLPKDV